MKTHPASKKEFVFLCGIPSQGLDHSRILSGGGRLNLLFPGTADFIHQMPDAIRQWRRLFLPVDLKKNFLFQGQPFFVNYMGDADCYSEALAQAINIVDDGGFTCFNHPLSVSKLRRDKLREIYGHIRGLHIPRCLKLSTDDISYFGRLIENHGFSYPVICRLAGTHGGKTQKLISSPGGWNELHSMKWYNEPVYIAEFVDYRDADGLYRKQRIAVVGGEVIPRHGCSNHGWSVSAENSPPETIEEEVAWNKTFFSREWPVLQERVQEIIRTTRLDYFGIDYSLRKDGTILVFEITASMSMTRPYGYPTHHSIEYIPREIQAKLAALLQNPRAWLEYRDA